MITICLILLGDENHKKYEENRLSLSRCLLQPNA